MSVSSESGSEYDEDRHPAPPHVRREQKGYGTVGHELAIGNTRKQGRAGQDMDKDGNGAPGGYTSKRGWGGYWEAERHPTNNKNETKIRMALLTRTTLDSTALRRLRSRTSPSPTTSRSATPSTPPTLLADTPTRRSRRRRCPSLSDLSTRKCFVRERERDC